MPELLDKKEIAKELTLGRRIKLAPKFFDPDGPRFNVRAICEKLTMTRKEFQLFTGVSANHHWEVGKFAKINTDETRKKIEKLLLLAVLIEDLFPDEQEGKFWLRLPNPNFDKKSPIDISIEGRIDEVLDVLLSIAEANTVA